MKDEYRKAAQEDAIHRARLEWYSQRAQQILRMVSAYDVLRANGVELSGSDAKEEQFKCPFHGADNKPSARIYPESATGPSHAWCFVCQEKRWDAIGLWRKFNGGEETPFGRVLAQMEKAYNLPAIEMPKEIGGAGAVVDNQAMEAFEALYMACENRLRRAKGAYQKLDMVGFLSASSILDKLRHRVDQKQTTPQRACATLNQLLERIGEKVRACPEG
jgi:hypothetical protein